MNNTQPELVDIEVHQEKVHSADSTTTTATPTLACDYAILGGGISGVFTAYQLAKNGKNNICVVESTDRLGGRLETFTLGNSKKYDIGGIRVNNQHTVMKNLAKELNITLVGGYYLDKSEAQDLNLPSNVLMVSRDVSTNDKNVLRSQAYPKATGAVSGWDVLLGTSSEFFINSTLQDTFSFTQAGLGSAEEMSYFQSTFRFRGDFQAVDRKTYAEFANVDSIDPLNFYPVGGMGEFVRKMSLIAQQSGKVRFLLSETVQTINPHSSSTTNKKYRIQTCLRNIEAKNVVIAIPPLALKDIKGSIAATLNAEPAFKQSKPLPVSTITMRFQQRWWEQASPARRIWTDSNCIQLIEIPITPSGIESNAFRVSYADGHCAREWNDLYLGGGKSLIEKTILQYLTAIYPGVSIPQPLETVFKLWPDAWYFEQPSAAVTLADKQKWALNPIQNENVVLVGEAFHLERTWSVGAVKSAIDALNQRFGVKTNY
ncbi:predicted protein [Naegleria gruberi]|uniref:monoamine oxidase n=1 Tax=Naegleria gruberi TaxID=5762 RepID=D2VZK2_NAEGR|nr:uncharacterized protein NAEGRDRAFT_81830 [Naegleria gruberi]EFC37715.1 predicted protein [Naegleria gruberi]|eukprot:XP_002670459.1 predicted protein [Naegleria gruberi strain NEG-M]